MEDGDMAVFECLTGAHYTITGEVGIPEFDIATF